MCSIFKRQALLYKLKEYITTQYEKQNLFSWRNTYWRWYNFWCILVTLRSWSWTVLWRPTRPFRANTQKWCPFHFRGLEWEVGSQETPGVMGRFGLWVQNEAGQRLIEFCQENTVLIANTLFQQHKRRLYTWTSADGQYWNQIDYTLCSQRWRSSIQSVKTRPGADCGSDHELLIAKFRLKL